MALSAHTTEKVWGDRFNLGHDRLGNAGGSIERLLRPVQLLLALHCVVENVHVNNEHRSEARLPVVRAGGGSLSR